MDDVEFWRRFGELAEVEGLRSGPKVILTGRLYRELRRRWFEREGRLRKHG